MIEATKDYRTRDEKLDDFQRDVATELSDVWRIISETNEAIINLQNRMTITEQRLAAIENAIRRHNQAFD